MSYTGTTEIISKTLAAICLIVLLTLFFMIGCATVKNIASRAQHATIAIKAHYQKKCNALAMACRNACDADKDCTLPAPCPEAHECTDEAGWLIGNLENAIKLARDGDRATAADVLEIIERFARAEGALAK